MVSIVPSIIPILTANAVATNQVKRKNKSLNNKEKKLKNSPLNNKINCRVFLNNGKVIEGHYEGNWYEDNSDKEGIWIKTDNGTEEINSKDYDRVEYYHKKTVNEAYIKGENGNVYYTKNSDMFLSMIKSIFISKNIPVRVYFDTIKQLYVFGDAFGYIHADLATSMKYYSKIYGADEMRANVSYLKQNCALFQVLPDDNFKEYDVGDGYTKGRFLILDDLIFACREKEYTKVRDNVPLFKDHIGEWMDVQYYLSKKNNINESVAPKLNDNFWKWFGNSKCVDAQGKPLVVYHGSSKLFNTFKQMKSKSGQLGADLGFWFTDNENIAKQFSNNAFVLDTDKKTYNEYIKSNEYNDKIKELKKKNEITLEDRINLYKDIVDKDEITNDELEYLKNIPSLKIKDIKEKKYRAVFQIYNMNLKYYKEDLKALNNEIKKYFSNNKDKPTVYSCYLSIQNPLVVKGEDIGVSWQRYSVISSAIDEGYDGVIIIDGDTGAGLSNEYIVFNPNQIKSVNNNGNWSDSSNNINESIEDKIIFEPTDATFVIGDKEFQDEGCNVYYIIINNTKVGMLALKKLYNGNIEIAGLEFGEPYRNKGYGKQVVKILKEKYGKIYVRAIPNAKGFWDKQGHKSSWNDDSGTFDGMLDESAKNNSDEKLNSKNNCKIILKDGKIIYGKLLSVNENYVYINSNNGNRIKKDDIKELYMYYDCEVITKNGKTIYGNFVGDFGDHKLHLDDSFNRKGWAIKDEMIEKVNYKKVIKYTFNTDTLNETVEPELNDNFWKWFGNSKVVDEQGKPLVVYHGWNKDFKEFILKDKDVKGIKCAFFSSDIDTAGSYSEFGNVKDFYLRIENPYIYDAGNSQYYIGKDTNHIMKALSEAQKGNYDGVIVKNIRDDSYQEYEEGYELPYSTTYIVFNPNQIKSVNNNGEWSITSNNINESVEDKILYIIRGVPGSGKSTLAHKLTDNVVEADQYFYDDKGNYNWSADKLNQAHNWCFYTVKKYMEEGRDKIAVANTFIKNKDYKRYVELAKEFGYKVDIRTCTGNYQNIHNVPDETVERMRSKFQETPLNEELIHMEKSNYEDYYAVILKNPSRKELRDNNLRRSRIINFANDIWLFFDSMQWVHEEVLDEYAKQYGKAKNSGFYDYDKNQFVFIHSVDDKDNEEQVFKKYEIEDKKWLLSHPYIVNVFGNNINVKVIDEYWNSPWDIEQLDESAENDKTLREYAVKLANICLDALVKTKYETRISKEQVQINVDKAFKKAVPMLKNSPYEYFLLLVSEKDEPNPSFGKTVDKKYGLISFPVFSSDPFDLSLSLLFKHKSTLNKLYSTYSGDELKLKMHEYATKYLKNEIKKRLENKKNTYLDLLIHECTHLLDDVRRTKTYKSKEQELKDDKGIEDYYNSAEEQNAYYQETVSIFDEYAENKLVGYKTFDIFWDDFIRQYRGEYNMLNDKNKRKLKKRAYAYWYVYMKD